MATFKIDKASWLTDPRSYFDWWNERRRSNAADALDTPHDSVENVQLLAALTSLSDRTTRPSIFSEGGGLQTSAAHEGSSPRGRIGALTGLRGNNELGEQILRLLKNHLTPIIAKSILMSTCRRCDTTLEEIGPAHLGGVTKLLKHSLKLYLTGIRLQRALRELDVFEKKNAVRIDDIQPIKLDINAEMDIQRARDKAFEMAQLIHLEKSDCTRVATATSELARNIFLYAGTGIIEINPIHEPIHGKGVEIIASDEGPGIPHLDAVLNGEYKSRTGWGMGLRGCKRMMTYFHVHTIPGAGTTVTIRYLPHKLLR
jgi:serine/threonine-protein kinase RsbT